jgi:hypothetical protein
LDRLVEAIRAAAKAPAKPQEPGAEQSAETPDGERQRPPGTFPLEPTLANLLGVSAADLDAVVQALGYMRLKSETEDGPVLYRFRPGKRGRPAPTRKGKPAQPSRLQLDDSSPFAVLKQIAGAR